MEFFTQRGYLHPVAPYDWAKSLDFLGNFAPTQYEQIVEGGSLTKAICLGGQTIAFQLAETGSVEQPKLAYTLFAQKPIPPPLEKAVTDAATFFLSLDEDLRPFYELGRDDSRFEPVIAALYGYHQVKFLTPFEAACWAVISQRNLLTVSRKMKQALTKKFGNRLELESGELWAFPEPQQLAPLDPAALTAIVGNERKGECLSAVARAFSKVDGLFFKTAPYDEVVAWLKTIKGIGDWSAAFVLIRGLGRMERLPLEEKRLHVAASQIYNHGLPITREAIIQHAQPYGPYQGYWAHYLRVAAS